MKIVNRILSWTLVVSIVLTAIAGFTYLYNISPLAEQLTLFIIGAVWCGILILTIYSFNNFIERTFIDVGEKIKTIKELEDEVIQQHSGWTREKDRIFPLGGMIDGERLKKLIDKVVDKKDSTENILSDKCTLMAMDIETKKANGHYMGPSEKLLENLNAYELSQKAAVNIGNDEEKIKESKKGKTKYTSKNKRRCLACGKEFQPTGNRQVYCTVACQPVGQPKTEKKQHSTVKPPPKVQSVKQVNKTIENTPYLNTKCPQCGRMFHKHNGKHIHCSGVCTRAAKKIVDKVDKQQQTLTDAEIKELEMSRDVISAYTDA